MIIGYSCDVGQKRKLNEDSVMYLTFDSMSYSGEESAGIFIVADGMGGHNAGEIASEWGIKTFARECLFRLLQPVDQFEQDEASNVNGPDNILSLGIKAANELLFEKAKGKDALQGMGTTLTAALITGQDLHVTHVGDSRCYIINDRETIQVTKDHSQVQELVDAGLMSREEARVHPDKNIITRVVGYYQEVESDSYHRKLYEGDNILCCSDGLWDVLSDQKISEIVLSSETPQQACIELVAQANQLGGPDNISVIVVRPEHLPEWQELLTLDTQAKRLEEATGNLTQKQQNTLPPVSSKVAKRGLIRKVRGLLSQREES